MIPIQYFVNYFEYCDNEISLALGEIFNLLKSMRCELGVKFLTHLNLKNIPKYYTTGSNGVAL